jgi:hypothetical protein
MTSNPPIQRLTRPLLTIAAILVSTAYALWGANRAQAALVGAAVGLLNWFALCWLMGRMVQVPSARRALLSLLLVAKIGLLMAAVFFLISKLALDPLGLAFGLGVLFLGPVVAGLLTFTSGSDSALARSRAEPRALTESPAASAAREEC